MSIRTLSATLLMLALVILFGSCATRPPGHSGGLPPGQAKKVYGTKSAKPFAPGQQKKHKHRH